jgi:hypothetical protein
VTGPEAFVSQQLDAENHRWHTLARPTSISMLHAGRLPAKIKRSQYTRHATVSDAGFGAPGKQPEFVECILNP